MVMTALQSINAEIEKPRAQQKPKKGKGRLKGTYAEISAEEKQCTAYSSDDACKEEI